MKEINREDKMRRKYLKRFCSNDICVHIINIIRLQRDAYMYAALLNLLDFYLKQLIVLNILTKWTYDKE